MVLCSAAGPLILQRGDTAYVAVAVACVACVLAWLLLCLVIRTVDEALHLLSLVPRYNMSDLHRHPIVVCLPSCTVARNVNALPRV